MQQSGRRGGEGEDATVTVQFMDLTNALIACKVAVELFDDDGLKAQQHLCRARCATIGATQRPLKVLTDRPPGVTVLSSSEEKKKKKKKEEEQQQQRLCFPLLEIQTSRLLRGPPFTLGKATVSSCSSPRHLLLLRLPPPAASSRSSPASPLPPRRTRPPLLTPCAGRWKRSAGVSALTPAMHIKTTKCSRFCLVAALPGQELLDRPDTQARFEGLFRSFDPEVQFQYFRSFRRSVHIGSPRLEPPKPDKQFLISPPASPPVGWAQSHDATPVINYDLLCAIAKLGPGDKYELQTATPTTPSVVVHVCADDDRQADSSGPDDGGGSDQDDQKPRPPRPKIIQTRRPDFAGVKQ
ncbi:hypothetical protein CRUP_027469 [Coryphaenoides rupestris]|nr:hypothetical protein CRUP_027469 [Coryphaenoides rupestris]